MTKRIESDAGISNDKWPEEGLVRIEECPICNCSERVLLYSECTDVTFGIAPGRWTVWSCSRCGTAWLDPMPSPDKIGLAYTEYYTHGTADHPIVRRIGKMRSFVHDLVEGYAASRYSAQSDHASSLGRWLIPLIPSVRSAVDVEFRHLAKAPTGGRLLDVGCGNGAFLERAEQLGWDAVGLEPDRKAFSVAQGRDLQVQCGGFEILDREPAEQYDVITLSHVIEHVHDPKRLLGSAHRLLRPGGRVWLETPNLNSLGHRKFGRSWRGLEVPRHLVLFNCLTLREILRNSGFCNVSQMWRGLVLFSIYAESDAISRDVDPRGASRKGHPPLLECLDELREMVRPERREFLTFTATKC